MVEEKFSMATIGRFSQLETFGFRLGSELEAGVDCAKMMVVAWEVVAKDWQVPGDAVFERLYLLRREFVRTVDNDLL